jgi:hypothetical protein
MRCKHIYDIIYKRYDIKYTYKMYIISIHYYQIHTYIQDIRYKQKYL